MNISSLLAPITKLSRKFVITPMILFALVEMGCATSGNPDIQDPTVLDQIKIGQSSKDDVLRLLGKPNFTSVSRIERFQVFSI